jgi:hypothetical protein
MLSLLSFCCSLLVEDDDVSLHPVLASLKGNVAATHDLLFD